MKKIIRLTESDLTRIVKRAIMEQNPPTVDVEPTPPNNTVKPKQCGKYLIDNLKNYLKGTPSNQKIKLENNVSVGIPGNTASKMVFVTYGDSPTCWCNFSDLM